MQDTIKHDATKPTRALPVSALNDELDQLAHQFNTLQDEQSKLQDYLRALPATLAHEIRTPIAIIGSSLEHLENDSLSNKDQKALIGRAREGLARLKTMLDAMNETNRLEALLAEEQREEFDLVNLLTQLRAAYQQTFPAWHFELTSDATEAPVSGMPDLIVQALDKLVANATSFTAEGEAIVFRLERRGLWWRLLVINPGPPLGFDANQLFAPMFSSRPNNQDGVSHMGLGLYVVKLVAEHHGGAPWARNRPDDEGVEVGFSIRT